MKNRVQRLLTIIVAFVSILGVVGLPKVAATPTSSNGFSISPVVTQITINKGQSQVIPITLENPTNIDAVAQPIINDFEAGTNESGSPKLLLKNNVTLPENNFKALVQPIPNLNVPANKTATVNVTISVPSNVASGGYYGVVRFIPVQTAQTTNVGLTASVGTLVLLTVPGNLTQHLNLIQLSAAQNGNTGSFFTSGNLSVVTRLQNTGNIHVAPVGNVQIKNFSGKVIYSYKFNDKNPPGTILPGSIRRFNDNLPSYRWFGRYTIVADISYGNSGNTLITSTSTFWYFPVWSLALGAVVILLIVAIIYWAVHKVRSRRFKRSVR